MFRANNKGEGHKVGRSADEGTTPTKQFAKLEDWSLISENVCIISAPTVTNGMM